MSDPRDLENPAGDKPVNLRTALALAERRIQALGQVCEALALEGDPDKRSALLSLLAIVVNNRG